MTRTKHWLLVGTILPALVLSQAGGGIAAAPGGFLELAQAPPPADALPNGAVPSPPRAVSFKFKSPRSEEPPAPEGATAHHAGAASASPSGRPGPGKVPAKAAGKSLGTYAKLGSMFKRKKREPEV